MKLPLLLAASLLVPTSLLLAQATPATPAPATPAAKAKPLGGSEKTFVKNSLDSAYFLTQLAEKLRGIERDNPVSDNLKKLSKSVGGDGNKIWAELATIANTDAIPLPMKLKPSDKSKVDALGKLKIDKLDKEFGELAAKETKDLLKTFESGAKNLQHAELKAIAEKWVPTLKVMLDEATALEKKK